MTGAEEVEHSMSFEYVREIPQPKEILAPYAVQRPVAVKKGQTGRSVRAR
jgi:hypothetical protein